MKKSSVLLVTTGMIAAFGMISPTALAVPSCFGQRPTIVGTRGNDNLQGTPRPDVIAGLGGADTIDSWDGNDRICGGDGDDTLFGWSGNDRIAGQIGHDGIHGGDGDDTITGYLGKDYLVGSPGNDSISGGPDTDATAYDNSQAGVQVNLQTGVATGDGSDTLASIEYVTGSYFDDTITGNSAQNRLYGQAGNDVITGGGGFLDFLVGNEGDDTLNAQDGDTGDVLEGNDHLNGDTCTVDPGDAVSTCEF